MKYILGAVCGFLVLNIIVLIIMTGATFITWENHFFYIDEWIESARGNYFIFGILFVFGGCCAASSYKDDSKSEPETPDPAYSDNEFYEKKAALDKLIHEAEVRLGINQGVNKS